MNRIPGAAVGLCLLIGLGLPGQVMAQDVPTVCDSPECCEAADGAELVGQVEPAGEEESLRAARVKFRFSHPANTEGARTTSFRTSADSAGRYRVCGIPTPVEVEATARAAGAASQTVTFTLSEPERLTLNLTVEPIATPEKVADSLRGALPTIPEGEERSAVAGRLMDDETGRPIADATVRLPALDRGAVTNVRGRFRIDAVPPGNYQLTISHIRYGNRTIEVSVPERQTVALDIRIPPEAIELEPVEVTVESEFRVPRLEDRGFYYRRELNFGHFYGPQYLTRWSGARVADVISRTPGLVLRSGTAKGRSPTVVNRSRGRECQPPVIVDGGMGPGGSWALSAPTSEIAAIEVYKGASQTAGSLYTGSGCGVILVWTWHGPNPFHGSATDSFACPERLERFRSHAC